MFLLNYPSRPCAVATFYTGQVSLSVCLPDTQVSLECLPDIQVSLSVCLPDTQVSLSVYVIHR